MSCLPEPTDKHGARSLPVRYPLIPVEQCQVLDGWPQGSLSCDISAMAGLASSAIIVFSIYLVASVYGNFYPRWQRYFGASRKLRGVRAGR